jgi:branched-chain amino acid transport system permease protein
LFDIFGFLVSWLTLFGIYAILSLCLNMEIGYTGMTNFGLVAFLGIGAFVTGYVSISMFLSLYGYNYPIYSLDAVIAMGQISGKNPLLNLSAFVASLILSFLVSGAIGYLITYPTLRVGPAFLGITILSFGEMLRIFMKHFEPTGGAYGLLGIPNPFAWVPDPALKSQLFMLTTLAILAGVFLYYRKLSESPYGRVLRSIREDEVASLCLGKPVPAVKARLLFVASGISGIAGSLLVFYTGSVSPDMFVTAVTFEVWGMVIVGGRGNHTGALVGAVLFSLLNRVSSALSFLFPGMLFDPNYVRWMLVGVIIVAALMYRPKGIFPEKPIRTEAWNIFEGPATDRGLKKRLLEVLKRSARWLLG